MPGRNRSATIVKLTMPLPAISHTIDSQYPKWLVRAFAIGIIACIIGVLIWLCSAVVENSALHLLGIMLFALGSVAVSLALLRGQDLDERNA
jgi:hypothetical protein